MYAAATMMALFTIAYVLSNQLRILSLRRLQQFLTV